MANDASLTTLPSPTTTPMAAPPTAALASKLQPSTVTLPPTEISAPNALTRSAPPAPSSPPAVLLTNTERSSAKADPSVQAAPPRKTMMPPPPRPRAALSATVEPTMRNLQPTHTTPSSTPNRSTVPPPPERKTDTAPPPASSATLRRKAQSRHSTPNRVITRRMCESNWAVWTTTAPPLDTAVLSVKTQFWNETLGAPPWAPVMLPRAVIETAPPKMALDDVNAHPTSVTLPAGVSTPDTATPRSMRRAPPPTMPNLDSPFRSSRPQSCTYDTLPPPARSGPGARRQKTHAAALPALSSPPPAPHTTETGTVTTAPTLAGYRVTVEAGAACTTGTTASPPLAVHIAVPAAASPAVTVASAMRASDLRDAARLTAAVVAGIPIIAALAASSSVFAALPAKTYFSEIQ
mmetsp:Transcript_3061/g.10963  ORF Transcript_3061/g.10963 Transcript_3061/m.10963 type:complete len:407 (+) Transcript_3061:1857-3077(+)